MRKKELVIVVMMVYLLIGLVDQVVAQDMTPNKHEYSFHLQSRNFYKDGQQVIQPEVVNKQKLIMRQDQIYIPEEWIKLLVDQKVAEQLVPSQLVVGGEAYIEAEAFGKEIEKKFVISQGVLFFYTEQDMTQAVLAQKLHYYRKLYKEELGMMTYTTLLPKQIPILLYHLCMEKASGAMAITPNKLDEHLTALKEAGYTTISFEDYYGALKYGVPLPPKPVILTFDDGYENNYTHAYPVLKKHGAKATFFVNAYTVDKDEGTYSHMDWEQLREMENEGLIEVQNHGYNHVLMRTLQMEKLKHQVMRGFERIEEELGARSIYVFAYPVYSSNQSTMKALEEWGVTIQVTTLDNQPLKGIKLYDVKRQYAYGYKSGKEIVQAIQ